MKTDAENTLGSLKKVNDFPFYVARYYGDYKINDFRKGAVKSPGDVVPFFESLLAGLGKPAKLSFPRPPDISQGCSAFFCRDQNGRPVVGKNNDWKRDPILLLKTTPPTGYASFSLVNLNFCDLFQLGSLEYNLLFSPYVPLDGMNEKGLVVLTLSVQEGSGYPIRPGYLTVGDFNLMRIILDTCADVEEALAAFERYGLMQTGPLPIHILMADKNGSCIVEFFEGKTHIKRDRKINYLTNFLALKNTPCDGLREPCDRYRTLEGHFEKNGGAMDVQEAKKILRDVSVHTAGYQIPSTIYSVLYSPEELCLKIRIGDKSPYYSLSHLPVPLTNPGAPVV